MGTLNRATVLMMAMAGMFRGVWDKVFRRRGKYDGAPGTQSKGSASKNKHPGACKRKGHAWRSIQQDIIYGDGDRHQFQCCRCNKLETLNIKDWSDPNNWNWHRVARHYDMTVREFASMVKANGTVQEAVRTLNYMRNGA